MSINKETIELALAIASALNGQASESTADHPYQIGKAYLFRLATIYRTGRVVRVTPQEIVLSESAWIADTGRYADALAKGTLNEVEPSPGQVIIGRAAVVDCDEWNHNLPRDQK